MQGMDMSSLSEPVILPHKHTDSHGKGKEKKGEREEKG